MSVRMLGHNFVDAMRKLIENGFGNCFCYGRDEYGELNAKVVLQFGEMGINFLFLLFFL